MPDQQVERQQAVKTICCCRIGYYNVDGSTKGHDSCFVITSGPDEPICQSCIRSGHPQDEAFDPIIKR